MLVWILFVALALAADRVALVLPASESPVAWSAPAALAGLVVGPAEPGASVALEDHGASWRVVARDLSGARKTLEIPAPRSSVEREDAVWLAVSLLASLPHPPDLGRVREGAGVAGRAPRPPAAAPRSQAPVSKAHNALPDPVPDDPAAADLRPALAIAPLAPPLDALAEAALPPPALARSAPLARPAAREAAPLDLSAVAWVGPALGARPGTTAAAGLEIGAGLAVERRLWLGLSLSFQGAQTVLDARPTAVQARATDAAAGLWWAPARGPVSPLLGLSGGLSWRSYAQDGVGLDGTRVVVLASEAGLSLSLSPRLALALTGRLGWDVDTTWLEWPDGARLAQSPLQGGAALQVLTRIP